MAMIRKTESMSPQLDPAKWLTLSRWHYLSEYYLGWGPQRLRRLLERGHVLSIRGSAGWLVARYALDQQFRPDRNAAFIVHRLRHDLCWDRARVVQWFESPHPSLQGLTPCEAIGTQPRRVVTALQQLEQHS